MKKKILYHSDFSLVNTGFGKAARLVLTHLYNTGKYDITHFCCGLADDHPEFERLPWKSRGALPASKQYKDPKMAQMASYGAFTINEVMKKETPDVYIGVQDIWGCDFAINKSWFVPKNMAIWTTLDSLPILPSAVDAAKKIDNFWCWSDFATKSLHELGHDHVKTLRGPLQTKDFYRLDDDTNLKNRKMFGIPEDSFIVGFVFRNQLRKSVPNLLEGYKLFLDQNKSLRAKTKLLLHTNFAEGWGIQKLAKEVGVEQDDILTTYVCSTCGSFGVHNFKGQGIRCPYCGDEKGYSTTGVQTGVSESQLNQVYNMMDVYCHPFTSGGQEIPIQEAKLAEKITLVTNYSCGEDNCVPEAASIPLEWSSYREHGTEFIKASTSPESIAKELKNVYDMPLDKRREMGKKARDWVVEKFSVEVVGKQLEEFIDSRETFDKDKIYSIKVEQNPNAKIDNSLEDMEWIKSMYKNILDQRVNDSDEGVTYWMQELSKGAARNSIEQYFRETARRDIEGKSAIESLILKEHENEKKVLFVIPRSIGDVYMCTSLFSSIKSRYPDYKLYVATMPAFQSLIRGHECVDAVINYHQDMEVFHKTEGGNNRETKAGFFSQHSKRIFDITYMPYINVQTHPNYTHNGIDKIEFDLK